MTGNKIQANANCRCFFPLQTGNHIVVIRATLWGEQWNYNTWYPNIWKALQKAITIGWSKDNSKEKPLCTEFGLLANVISLGSPLN